MKRDTLGTLRARIAELEAERLSWQQLHSTLFAEKNQWFAEAAKQATRADEATRRAEVAEAALREIVACPDGKSKTWPQIDAIVRRVVVVEGQEPKP